MTNDATARQGRMTGEPDSGYYRLEDQIAWYDSKSAFNQTWYKRLKIASIAAAALIPFLAPFSAIAAGALGVLIVIIEGVQQLYQFHDTWTSYRSTCEALRHEKYLFLARSGPYELPDEEAKKELAARVESLISTEHAKWVASREMTKRRLDKEKEAEEKPPDGYPGSRGRPAFEGGGTPAAFDTRARRPLI